MLLPASRAWILLVLGLIAAGAALFAPSERWAGIDPGATGAVVFMFTLGAAIWLFGSAGERVFPEHTSIAERRTWLGLVFLAIILATFIRDMVAQWMAGTIPERPGHLFVFRFVQQYLMLIIAWSVISHLIGRRAGGVEADERDLELRHRADRAGDWALTLIVIGAINVLAWAPREILAWWLSPIVLANVLIGLLIAKSLVEHVVLAHCYRSGGH